MSLIGCTASLKILGNRLSGHQKHERGGASYMPGMLTIDAEEVRSVANGLGNIESQLKSDTEQIAWQLTTLEAALQYTDVGVSGQIRQAITQMNEVTQLLLTAQTRLLQVVSDTLQLEAVID